MGRGGGQKITYVLYYWARGGQRDGEGAPLCQRAMPYAACARRCLQALADVELMCYHTATSTPLIARGIVEGGG